MTLKPLSGEVNHIDYLITTAPVERMYYSVSVHSVFIVGLYVGSKMNVVRI